MNIANKISIFRILSVPFFVAALIYYSPQKDFLRFVALAIFALGVISDCLDGYIARKAKQISKAGTILDPLGDKLLLVSAFISLSVMKDIPVKFPLWVALLVVSRDIMIVVGTVIIYMLKQKIEVFPTRWGKLTTTFQMAAVAAVLLALRFAFIFWWLAVFFTVISGVDYLRRGFRIIYAVDNNRSVN